MRWELHWIAAVLLLTAGCVGAGDEAGPTGVEPASEGANETSAPEGTNGTSKPKVVRDENHWVAGATVADRSLHVLGDRGHPVVTLPLNTTGIVSVLSWNASTPASEELRFRIEALESETVVAKATGTSPIRLEVPAEELAGNGDYALFVEASGDPAGAFVDQGYAIETTVFSDIPFEPSEVPGG